MSATPPRQEPLATLRQQAKKRLWLVVLLLSTLVAAVAGLSRWHSAHPSRATSSTHITNNDSSAAPNIASPTTTPLEETPRQAAQGQLPFTPPPAPTVTPETPSVASLHPQQPPAPKSNVPPPPKISATAQVNIATPSNATSPSHPTMPPSTVVETPPAPPPTLPKGAIVLPYEVIKSPNGYQLQFGTFHTPEQARQLQKQLAKQGVKTHLETRVQLGPFKDKAQAEEALVKLKLQGIEVIMLAPLRP